MSVHNFKAVHPVFAETCQSEPTDHQTDIVLPRVTSLEWLKRKQELLSCSWFILNAPLTDTGMYYSRESIWLHVFSRPQNPSLMELKYSQHYRQRAWFSCVILASWILLTGSPFYSPEVFFKPEKKTDIPFSVSVSVSVSSHLCVYFWAHACVCLGMRAE